MDPTTTEWAAILRQVEELWSLPEQERDDRLRALEAHDPETWRHVSALIEADASPPGFLRAAGGLDFALALEEDAPEQLGPWRIEAELGRGGMGRVYVAERSDGRFERRVALKVLPSSFQSEGARRYFDDEVRLLARLEHPNIARLYDAGVEEGVPYLVMELVDGIRIDDYCDAEGLDASERIALFESVCEAVQHAHQNLVIHRDLKPSNILVRPDGSAKLLDFGIARLEAESSTGSNDSERIALTPAYASPEQRRGEPVAAASDVYSLGVILHELVTGRRPRGDDAVDVDEASGWTDTAIAIDGESVAYRSLPRRSRTDLDCILARALQPDPDERYPSVQALLDDLRRFRAMRPVSVRAPTRRYLLERFLARHRAPVAASVVLGVLLLGSVASALWQGRQAAIERDVAEREAARAEEVTAFLTSVFETVAPWEGGVADDVSARELLDRGARRIETDLAGAPLLQAEMMIVLGQVYQGLSIDDSAERLLEGALEQRTALLGAGDPETIEAMLAVAGFQSTRFSREARHVTRGVQLYEAAIDLARDVPDGEPLLARALTGLGALAIIAFDAPISRERSKELLEESLEIATRLDDDVLVSDAAHYLGWWHVNAGDNDQAADFYRTALDLRSERWGARSPTALSTAHQLGWFYQSIGRNDDAAAHFELTFEARRELYGEDHPRTASTATGLAAAWIGQGRHEEAEVLLRDALGPMARSAADTTLASARGWLARALAGQGKMEEASAEFAWAVENGDGARIARVVNDYAVHLAAMGRAEEAEAMYRRALDAYRAEAGPDHPFTGIVAGNLAAVISRQGRDEEAAVLLEEAIDILERAYGPDHATVGNSLRDLGWARLRQGRMDEAQPHLERAHDILTEAYGAEHWRTGVVKLYLGVGYRALERFDDAEETLLESHRILEPHRSARPDDWYWVNAHLAALYTQLGRDAEADRFREAVAG